MIRLERTIRRAERAVALLTCAIVAARASAPPVAIGSAKTYGDGKDLLIVSFANGVRMSRRVAERLRAEVGEGWPQKVTAFRPEMAVHGKHGEPCPVCGAKVQRIKYADRETNYCARCQTGGRPLADRALSRFLGKDWPKTLEELEERRGGGD